MNKKGITGHQMINPLIFTCHSVFTIDHNSHLFWIHFIMYQIRLI